MLNKILKRFGYSLIKNSQIQETILNQYLIDEQQLSYHDVKSIESLHHAKNVIFAHVAQLSPVDDIEVIRKCSNTIMGLDKLAQNKWKFSNDASKLTWWFQIPHCTCDIASPREYLEDGLRIFPHCNIHI